MNAVFIGGGSLRLLPLLRGVFANSPECFRNGEIRLVDREASRAEAVGKLLSACPEYRNVNCRVRWSDDLEACLPGADVLYLTMGARSEPTYSQSMFISNRYGFFSTDNLSVNGAFLSLRLGRTVLSIARQMEKHCPKALMLIFANPVAVYSHLVNTHTRIRALGICGGFINHRWDLSRIIGRDEYDPDWEVVAAGVNHLSFILRGSLHGRDLYSEILPEYLNESWKPVQAASPYEWARKSMLRGQRYRYQMFHRYGKIIFSGEADGTAFLFPEQEIGMQTERYGTGEDFDAEAAQRMEQEKNRENYRRLTEASNRPGQVDWNASAGLFARNDRDIILPLFRAISGIEKMRIAASRPNFGAVRGFAPEMPLEYSMDILGSDITPVKDLYVPEPFTGLITALSEFQLLLSEAIAAWNPNIFADALDAFPMQQHTEKRKAYYREMFELFSDLDPHMLEACRHYQAAGSPTAKRYTIVEMNDLAPVRCPCGFAKRAFASDNDKTASLHIVDIQQDSKVHYHRKHTEIYHILEGSGTMELDGEIIPIQPGFSIRISPECRHRASGKLKILNVSIPSFDPQDEWFD